METISRLITQRQIGKMLHLSIIVIAMTTSVMLMTSATINILLNHILLRMRMVPFTTSIGLKRKTTMAGRIPAKMEMDDVSQRQEPQKVEGMEQVDFRIQHRIEQRDECPGNQQAQQEADCREERRLLEIAQHHAPYRFAQQSSGSHLFCTVADLSHRKIDVAEQG